MSEITLTLDRLETAMAALVERYGHAVTKIRLGPRQFRELQVGVAHHVPYLPFRGARSVHTVMGVPCELDKELDGLEIHRSDGSVQELPLG